MQELKFSFEKDEDVPGKPVAPNIFSGDYKFSTQNTAVYGSFALVETEDEILSLRVECDRLFYRDGRIAVLKDGKLDVYENMKYVRSLSLGKDGEGLNDLLPEEVLQEHGGAGYASCFMAGGDLLKITESTVSLRGQEVRNTINERGCRYFVAHRGGVTVIGNDKSYEFMYFLGERHMEPEECNSPSLRIDEELDMVNVRDAKFCGSCLMLKDRGKNIYYRLEGLGEDGGKSVYDCEIINGTTITKKRTEGGFWSGGGEESVSGPKSGGQEGKHHGGRWQPAGLGAAQDAASTSDGKALCDDQEVSTKDTSSNLFDFGNIRNSTGAAKPEDRGASINGEKLICSVFSRSSSDVKNEALAVCGRDGQASAGSTSGSAGGGTCRARESSAADSGTRDAGREDTSEGSSKLGEEQDKNVRWLKDTFERRLDGLRNRYDRLAALRPHEAPLFKMTECSVDCARLYNRVFHSKIEDYNDALSSMIVGLELYGSVDAENINQGIKYVDSRMLERQRTRPSVRYTSPLIRKPDSVRYVDERMDALIEGMKIIGVSRKEAEGGSEDASMARGPSPSKAAREADPQSRDADPAAGGGVETHVASMPAPLPGTAQHSPSLMPGSAGGSGAPFLAASDSQQSLFGNVPVNNPMHVSDTTSLFNQLSSARSPALNTSSEGDAPEPSSGSAFSRLTGSRRMFK